MRRLARPMPETSGAKLEKMTSGDGGLVEIRQQAAAAFDACGPAPVQIAIRSARRH